MKAKLIKLGIPAVLVLALGWLIFAPPARVGYAPEQPIAYSHKLHAGQYNLDCQYCHSGVTESKHAGVPSLNTCNNCHLNVAVNKPEIKKLKQYINDNKSPEWVKIHNLPDHVRFAHAPHVKALLKEGAPTKEACQKCHGDIWNQEVVAQVAPLNMGWCVNCHRDYRDEKHPVYKDRGVTVSCNTCHY